MQTILVANPKGGSGKTTLATNLAGFFAWRNDKVTLGDMDRQQSSLTWLAQRPAELPGIAGWDAREEDAGKPPRGTTCLILDSPAGLHGKRLTQILKQVDKVIIPVQPSALDMWATADFIQAILEEKAVRKKQTYVGIVGNRVDARTRVAWELEAFLAQFDLPVLTYLRDAQVYVQAAAVGRTLFDLSRSRSERELEQWLALVDWARERD